MKNIKKSESDSWLGKAAGDQHLYHNTRRTYAFSNLPARVSPTPTRTDADQQYYTQVDAFVRVYKRGMVFCFPRVVLCMTGLRSLMDVGHLLLPPAAAFTERSRWTTLCLCRLGGVGGLGIIQLNQGTSLLPQRPTATHLAAIIIILDGRVISSLSKEEGTYAP
jgi:hypothetical protein